MAQANIGWKFYKDYYRNPSIDWRNREKNTNNERIFNRQNGDLFRASWPTALKNAYLETPQKIVVKTTYPGLLIGSGYNHETGALGEIKIGFYFDHTTGLPTIPGSSVKGLLRSAFEHPAYVQHLLSKQGLTIPKTQVKKLRDSIFEGSGKGNMYQHDVFYDAYISQSNPDGRILGSDFITPHKDPLKNPIPLQFLKVLPNVEFTFCFEVQQEQWGDGFEMTVEQKLKLFSAILGDLGIGAKTNVGYGHFEILS